MDRDMLIQYVDIINKMENIPYDVRMSHNDLDYSIIHFVEEQASTDEELKGILMDLKSMSCEERMTYIKEYLDHREASSNQGEEGELATMFGVDIRDIQHLFLENGNEIFSFYDSHSGKDIVLANENHGKSLVEQLKVIQQENEKYQEDDDTENAHSILIDEAIRNNLTIPFYSKEELFQHPQELDSIISEDRTKINYLLAHYEELNIIGINVANMIYIDGEGNIHQVVLTPDHKVQIVKPASYNHFDSENEKENDTDVEDSNELEGMLNDSYSMEEEEYDYFGNKKNSKNKQKVLVKKDYSDGDYGFTNNAFYLFLILFGVLFLIFIILFIFIL